MNRFQLQHEASAEAAAAAAGEALNDLLTKNGRQPLLLLLSGGSSLGLLDFVNARSKGEQLTVAMLDERFSHDPEISNFAQMQRTDFYQLASEANANFFGSMPRPGETSGQLAERLQTNLRTWRQKNSQGKIIATLGLGPDGHTAGMFPYPEDSYAFKQLFEGEDWVTSYQAATKNIFPDRITATVTLLKEVDVGLAYVCGAEKQAKLKELLAGQTTEPARLPAMSWHEIKQVTIYTDLDVT